MIILYNIRSVVLRPLSPSLVNWVVLLIIIQLHQLSSALQGIAKRHMTHRYHFIKGHKFRVSAVCIVQVAEISRRWPANSNYEQNVRYVKLLDSGTGRRLA